MVLFLLRVECSILKTRFCAVIPTYNNPITIRLVAEKALEHVETVIIVDDASRAEGHDAVASLSATPGLEVVWRESNGGKGAAVKDGLRKAHELGFTHALQVDADNQHDLSQIPILLAAASKEPESLVLAYPQFDASVPKSRLHARQITIFWTTLETWGRAIIDPMCGFRVYPLKNTLRALPRSNHMDFDPEIAVRLVWLGTPVTNLPVKVRYLTAEEGGISNFDMLWDNVRISWMHTRLFILSFFKAPGLLLRRWGQNG